MSNESNFVSLFDPGDIVKVVGLSWTWNTLRVLLPNQITDQMVFNNTPIRDVAEVTHVYDKKIGGKNVRCYLLRFPPEYDLEVTSEFASKYLIKLDKSVFARDAETKTQG